MIKLRDYQKNAVKSIYDSWRDNDSCLVVMATGLGKTVVLSQVIDDSIRNNGGRWLVVAGRQEIVEQNFRTLSKVTGQDVAIEMAENRTYEYGFRKPKVISASVQTLIANSGGRARMEKFNPNEFSGVIIDEAHHAVSPSYQQVIDYFNAGGAKVLGVTATPDRADEMALGKVFESVAFEYDVVEGILNGWLVPIKQCAVNVSSLDFSGVKTTAGDLNGAELSDILTYEENLHRMVYPTIEIAKDRRCLIFAATVAHAERIAEIINRHGSGKAASVRAGTPKDERRDIFRRYADGEFQFLVNVGIATEGWDDPATDGRGVQMIAMMRPTKSRSLYSQMCGRGTRALPGTIDGILDAGDRKQAIANSNKKSLTVLDFVGNAGRHKLMHAGDILGGKWDDEVVSRVYENAQKSEQEEIDLLLEMNMEEANLKREAEAKRRSFVRVSADYNLEEVSPFDFLGVVPKRVPGWFKGKPITDKQASLLRRNGVPNLQDLNVAQASQLIDHIMSRPSDKQAQVLKRAGLDPNEFDRQSASDMITKLKNNSWKVPTTK
jgi:superfamily II DNA or RNA helicase